MPDPDEWIPVAEEVLTVTKQWVPTGRVRVETRTEAIDEIVEAELARSEVEVVRVPVGREVEVAPEVRTEGDTTIIPVVEERLVVQRRLVLTEEVHVKRRRTVEAAREPVTLRRQRAIISREGRHSLQRSSSIMTDITTGSRALTAFFDDRGDAEAAVDRLRALGITDTSIRMTGGEEYAGRAAYHEERGFWDSVLDFFFPAADSAVYAEGLRRGGYLVTVSGVPAEQYDQAVDILDDEGSVDIDERASSWQGEDWRGTGGEEEVADARRTPETWGDSMAPGAGTDLNRTTPAYEAREPGDGARTGTDDTIPVVEERLRVGKRDVNLGRVRVRSYVVEEPASADVSLSEERVEVERRPVDRPVRAGEDAFVDRMLEAEERAEEPVVDKEARVTEEIGLRREGEEHTETVSGTVRHTEVEVEDDRDEGAARRAARR